MSDAPKPAVQMRAPSWLVFFPLLASPALLSSQTAAAAAPLACPATIRVTESASAKAPWHPEAATAEHKFLRPSIYNGEPGKDEAELAPDDTQTRGKQVTQTWKLSDYRDRNLFLRCRYDGTASTLVVNLPARLTTCTFSFRNMPGNQPVAAPVFACQ